LRGIEGVMFKQMALTVSFSLLAALIVALTLIPMLSSQFLRVEKKGAGVTRSRFNEGYLKWLGWCLGNRKTVLSGSFLLLAVAFGVFYLKGVGAELFPEIDEGIIDGSIEMPVGTRLEITDRVTREVERIITGNIPEMEGMFARAGGSWRRGGGSNMAFFRVNLVEKRDRDRSTREVVAGLRPKLTDIPDADIRISEGRSMYSRILGQGREERLEIDLTGYDLEKGKLLAQDLVRRISPVEGVIYPRISIEDKRPELRIVLDRRKAATMGLPVSRILQVINTNVEGTIASHFREGGDEFDVLVRLREKDRARIEDIQDIFISRPGGEEIPLKSFARVVEGKGPTEIERRNQQRLITVRAGIQDRDLAHVVQDIGERIRGIQMPRNFRLNFASEYEQQKEAFGGLLFAIVLAIVLVYMVMASQFESLSEPFVIMFTVPFAAIGVILAMLLLGMNMTIPVLIGAVLLIGIVVNNGIVLIDCIGQLRRQGNQLEQAILTGGRRRLRPIMMTTCTTALALIPMALGLGEGAEMNAPMARVVIGGIVVSALFTLFFVPTLYATIKGMGRENTTEGA
jgi:HAE1 family hydrophobic/amphiphilic exporter-1